MHEVDLRLTDSSKRLLAECIESMEIEDPVTAVIWHDGGVTTLPDGRKEEFPPGWGVAWYKGENTGGLEIQKIEGFKFVFGQGEKSLELNGRVLDAKGGKFEVL
jgi:hypothetical protein